MKTAIDILQAAFDAEKDKDKKAELRKAIDALKRGENATEHVDSEGRTTDMRDPNYKQIGNAPSDNPREELANVKAERNRLEGPLPETTQVPDKDSKTPPPVQT